jgi:LysM repeat protein
VLVPKRLWLLGCAALLAACAGPTPRAPSTAQPLAAAPTAVASLVPSAAPTVAASHTPGPVTPTATAEPDPIATTGPISYTVQTGDTLWSLAEQFGLPAELLAGANPTINPEALFPGDILVIPDPRQPLLDVTVAPGEMGARVLAEVDLLRLRAAPNTEAAILAQLVALTPLKVVGRTADSTWLQVITVLGDTHGWVSADYVEVFVALEQVPVVTAVPLPTLALPLATGGTPVAPTTPLPPGDYRYVSGVTGRVREIFLHGQALGNRANVFSKIGDSITVSPVFLTAIGLGSYQLHERSELQPVIDYYASAAARQDDNSFAYTSLSAKVGWRARAVLSPELADPAFCQPDEGPLACEYRVVQPSVALIMLGTNDVSGTPVDQYETDMRSVIELTLERGIIPVISTLPPLVRPGLEGRVELLNGVLVRLAGEYQVPLWDYWAALQGLPNQGLAGDGVHPNWAPAGHSADFSPEYLQYGMTVRNLTGLYVLDAVWRTVIQP